MKHKNTSQHKNKLLFSFDKTKNIKQWYNYIQHMVTKDREVYEIKSIYYGKMHTEISLVAA